MIEKAYAKVNLGLQVIRKREDGYHDLKMVMAPIDLCDIISIEESNKTIVNMISDKEDIPMEKNIVYKTIMLLKERYHISKNVIVRIEKNIPMGAGLGGGSSDAAATLKCLNKFWRLNISKNELVELALMLGSDVPFFIESAPAICEGLGIPTQNISIPTFFDIIVIAPTYQSFTKDVFQKCVIKEDDGRFDKLIKGFNNNKFNLFNDLESFVFTPNNEKSIEEMKSILIDCGCINAIMTGSGSSVIGIIDSKMIDNSIKKIKKELPNYQIMKCKFENVFIL